MSNLLTPAEFTLVDKLKSSGKVPRFVDIADVDIGIVTGANNYFVVNQQTVEEYALQDIALPMLARSELIKGITYTLQDHEDNIGAAKNVFFLNFPSRPISELPPGMVRYIRLGEESNLHQRYKCRIRTPWYSVPYVWACEVALLKRCHLFPRLVWNQLPAYSTDTAYRIRMLEPYRSRMRDFTFSFLNSLTFLCAEIAGRHYAGGVLELVPTEIESLLVPICEVDDITFHEVDEMIRNGSGLDQLVGVVDQIVLGRGLGISQHDIEMIREAHRRLQARRLRADALAG